MATTVLITGAAGFIGSHLVDRYLERGDAVIGIDNFVTGSERNLTDARSSDRFTFLEADITADGDALRARVAERAPHVDLVLHFASPASPIDYAQLPVETLKVNSIGTTWCAESAKRWNARLLYASTSETYGDPLEHPQRESYWGNVNPIGPRSCYDESKRFGEAMVMAYIRAFDLDARIIRIFNTYGPRMRENDGRVVPNFVRQALDRKPLTIYGNGEQTRSFCFVDDLVEGIMRCAASSKTRGLVVNLGNPGEYTIRQFAEVVARIAGVPLEMEAHDMPVDDPARRRPDISRAKELLDWEPAIGVDDGLGRTIAFFRSLEHEGSMP